MAKKQELPACRAHVYYGGRVQGVGFRHLAEGFAQEAGLTGFVKNTQDGRVELVCEGPKQKIEALLAQIQYGPLGRYIQKADCSWETPSGEFTDFTVEFHY